MFWNFGFLWVIPKELFGIEVCLALAQLISNRLPVRKLFISLSTHQFHGLDPLALILAHIRIAFFPHLHGRLPPFILLNQIVFLEPAHLLLIFIIGIELRETEVFTLHELFAHNSL